MSSTRLLGSYCRIISNRPKNILQRRFSEGGTARPGDFRTYLNPVAYEFRAVMARPVQRAGRHFDPQGRTRRTGMGKAGGIGTKIGWGFVAGILLAAVFVAGSEAGLLDGLFKKSPAEAAKTAGVVETADQV